MRSCMDLLQLADGYVSVDFGGSVITVAQHSLDKAHLCAVLQHVGGHGVAE